MGKSRYIIQFGGLPVGVHEFEFDVTEKFFKNIENSEVQKAALEVKTILTKQNNLLQLEFVITGTVGIECDRCLKDFDYPLDSSQKLVVKYGDPEESNDDILVITEGETEVDISHYIYEYVILAIPARKVPCEIDEKKFICDEATLKKLKSISSDSEKENKPTNPIWEKLNKLKNHNKN